MKICLTVPERFAAQAELPALLREPADLTLFPEGFLRSQEDLDLALRLTEERPGTVVAGYRDGDWEKALVIERGRVADEYTKCILTPQERDKGKRPGGRLHCLNSSLGRLAVPVCYGEPLLEVEGTHGAFCVEVEPPPSRPIDYFADRRPELFGPLAR